MRAIIKNLAFGILFFSFMAQAQEQPDKLGFVRLVNVVAPGEGVLQLEIDGNVANPQGYQIGDITGGIGLKPGNHQISISRAGVKAAETRISVVINETTILIPFAERVPATDFEPAHWAIRVLRLKQKDSETGQIATFISVSREPEVRVEMMNKKGKWETFYARRLATSQAKIDFEKGYVPLKVKEKTLKSIPIGGQGNYVVLLYDDVEEGLQSLTFQDYKYLSAD